MAQYGHNDEVNKLKKKPSEGHEFELKFTSPSKNKANREARKYRKRGFQTRVRETCPGMFSVYRRSKRAE
jgi:hypothetical protein